MIPEQQLIEHIKQILQANQLDNRLQLEDLAEQFADLCRNTNARLLRCADYLSKGRRSEAVFEAQLAPNLLLLADALSGAWLKKWQNVIADLELSPFAPMDFTLVEQLQEASQSEQSLEPLLKEYRRCVYQSDHESCIRILRQIRAKDPANANWEKNLRPLEEQSLPYWLQRCEHGLESMDLADLKEVFAELTHPQRVVPPPPEVMTKLRRALLSERAQDLYTEAELLMAKLSKAMERKNAGGLQELWNRCAALEADEAFLQKPPNWETVQSESHRLADRWSREQSDRQAFEQAVSHVRDLLMSANVNPLELRHDYERLESWGLPIPELLSKQIDERLSDLRRRRRRRTLCVSVSILLAVLLLAGLSLGMMFHSQRKARRADWLARAEQYSRNDRLDELETLLEEIRLSDSSYYAASELSGIREKLTQSRLLQERNRRAYQSYRSTLEDIRNGGYRGSQESIQRAIENTKSVAVTAEEKDYVIRWQNEWVRFSARQERDLEARLTPRIMAIQAALANLSKASGEGLEEELNALQRLGAKLASLDQASLLLGGKKLRTMHGVLKGQLDARLADVKLRLSQWENAERASAEVKKQQRQKLVGLQRDIPLALPDFQRYERLLKEYLSLGKGCPEMTDYRTVVSHLSDYQRVVSLRGRMPAAEFCSRKLGAGVTALLEDASPVSESIWRPDLERVRVLCATNDVLQRKASSLISLRKSNLYVMKLRRRTGGEWVSLYSDRPFQSQERDGVILYWGNAFWASDSETRVTLVPTAKINGGAIMSSKDFDVILARNKFDSLAPHVRLMKKLVAEAMRSADVPVYLLGELEKLRHSTDVDPVQGLLIFKRFINLLATHCVEEIPESRLWAHRANALDTDIPWQRFNHPQTVEARRQIKDFWASVPDLKVVQRRLQMNRELLQALLHTELRCVGSVQLDSQGQKALFPCAPASEYWAYRPAGFAAVASFQLLKTDEQGRIFADQLQRCPIGMPVYAPQAGHDLQPVVRRLQTEHASLFQQALMPQAMPVGLGRR